MHLTGLQGMPRRVYTYPAGLGFETLNLVSTIGAVILAAGFLVFLADVIRSRTPTSRNPWRAGTLEWLAEMPPKPWGVRSAFPIVLRKTGFESDGQTVGQTSGLIKVHSAATAKF